jgi:hypothetical protein
MEIAPWTIAAYVGIGAAWLIAMLVLARREYDYVSFKEAVIHVLAWPFVLVVLRLWWVAFVAVAIIGLAAISALAPMQSLMAELSPMR